MNANPTNFDANGVVCHTHTRRARMAAAFTTALARVRDGLVDHLLPGRIDQLACMDEVRFRQRLLSTGHALRLFAQQIAHGLRRTLITHPIRASWKAKTRAKNWRASDLDSKSTDWVRAKSIQKSSRLPAIKRRRRPFQSPGASCASLFWQHRCCSYRPELFLSTRRHIFRTHNLFWS